MLVEGKENYNVCGGRVLKIQMLGRGQVQPEGYRCEINVQGGVQSNSIVCGRGVQFFLTLLPYFKMEYR